MFLLPLSTACGGEAPSGVEPAAVTPFREQIDPAREAQVAQRKLAARDTPLAVGDAAPAFDALPADKPAVVVFYRGHW